MGYENKFVELNVVEAALAEDEDGVDTLLETMLAGERRALRRSLRAVINAIDVLDN
ncbi:hypothetical protein [Mycobacterium sp. JS623]|uniref:hypothetical protein n=1 Tax=Mycobacterium sp. JS623 TaxID=212767 RepID=UPI0012FCF46E|nr:hypothetical protein [Mycobacterium sp. JS623]